MLLSLTTVCIVLFFMSYCSLKMCALKFCTQDKSNKKNYNMILSCYNYGRVTIIYDAIVNY